MGGLEERHVKELEENRAQLEQSLPMNFKHSAELLNLKQIELQLARQKQYGLGAVLVAGAGGEGEVPADEAEEDRGSGGQTHPEAAERDERPQEEGRGSHERKTQAEGGRAQQAAAEVPEREEGTGQPAEP